VTTLVPGHSPSADRLPGNGALLPRMRSEGSRDSLRDAAGTTGLAGEREPTGLSAGLEIAVAALRQSGMPASEVATPHDSRTAPVANAQAGAGQDLEETPPSVTGPDQGIGAHAGATDPGGDWADVVWGALETSRPRSPLPLRRLGAVAPPPLAEDPAPEEPAEEPWLEDAWLVPESPPAFVDLGEQDDVSLSHKPLVWPPVPGSDDRVGAGWRKAKPVAWVRLQVSERLPLVIAALVILLGAGVGTAEELAGHSTPTIPAGGVFHGVVAGSGAPTSGAPAGHKPSHRHASKPSSTTAPAKTQQPPPSGRGTSPATSTSTTAPTTTVVVPTDLLTAASAQSAFDSTWPSFVSAANSGSSGALDQVATPGVVDVAVANSLSAGGAWPGSTGSVDISAPAETSYPLSFAAEVAGAGAPVIAVLEQLSASSPWQVAWVVSGVTQSLPGGTSTGTAASPFGGGSFSTPIAELAEVFQALRSSGKAPAGNPWDSEISSSGSLLGTIGTSLVTDYQASVADQRHDAVSYSASNFSPIFTAGDGWLMCGEIDAQTVETPSHGGVLVQPPNRSSYGPTLGPGNYSSITASATRDACVAVSSGGAVSLAGLTGGLYAVSGTAS
jgi:hypothetical protein